jgi:membrane fusion protein, macrolide-specific efflux system
MKTFLIKIKDWFLHTSLLVKIILLIILAAAGWFIFSFITQSNKSAVKYQTSKVTRENLIATVTGSGQVSTANNGTISTLATGVVTKLYVKDGDEVKTGDKIAEIESDLKGQQNVASAWSNYLSAKNSLESAKINMYTTQSSMYSKWDTFFNLATSGKYQKGDGSPDVSNRALPEFTTAQDNWLAAEATYKNQQNVVSQAQSSLNSAWLSYQQTSPTILAPISGIISGLSLQEGSVIVESTSTSNSAQSATKIANIKTKALPMVSISLTEVDIPKIKIGDKATVEFDALTDKTFTGKVISIDTAGSVSSGVTTYPTVIRLDSESNEILSNMAATANIITAVKENVLTVPITAIQKQTDGTSYVKVMKNGSPIQKTVEVGLSSSSQTEITSGLSEGDTVVTSTTSQQQTTQTTSVFGGGLGGSRMR